MEPRIRLDSYAGLPTYRPVQTEKQAPCQAGCVSGGDTRGWIGVVSQRHRTGLTDEQALAEAWKIITDANPFPAVMGRICPHPCEGNCSRTGKDSPVAINALERFIGDWAIDNGLPLVRLEVADRPESIGVVGAGPSGLSFAYQMARRGYQVVVYERHHEPGGMLRFGVPDYRLPPGVLDAEIGRIQAMGVRIVSGVDIGAEIGIEELRARHDILYLGLGAQKGRPLDVPGAEGPGVYTGVDFLGRVNRGEQVPLADHVVVIGGGNTAVDAARVARRAGAAVTLAYRRTAAEMPAISSEVLEAEREGVVFRFLTSPVAVVREDGAVAGVEMVRMVLGEPESDGRRRPVPQPGSEFLISGGSVIAAVSQEAEEGTLASLGVLGPFDGESSEVGEGIWAGGDLLGLDVAGTAIAHGRRAAEAVDRRLRGLPARPADSRRSLPAGVVNLRFLEHSRRVTPAQVPVEAALADPTLEVSRTITKEEFLAEIERCFSCGLCLGCQACWMYCTKGAFTPVSDPEPGRYFTMTLDECEECGKCIEVCPCGYLEVAF